MVIPCPVMAVAQGLQLLLIAGVFAGESVERCKNARALVAAESADRELKGKKWELVAGTPFESGDTMIKKVLVPGYFLRDLKAGQLVKLKLTSRWCVIGREKFPYAKDAKRHVNIEFGQESVFLASDGAKQFVRVNRSLASLKREGSLPLGIKRASGADKDELLVVFLQRVQELRDSTGRLLRVGYSPEFSFLVYSRPKSESKSR